MAETLYQRDITKDLFWNYFESLLSQSKSQWLYFEMNLVPLRDIYSASVCFNTYHTVLAVTLYILQPIGFLDTGTQSVPRCMKTFQVWKTSNIVLFWVIRPLCPQPPRMTSRWVIFISFNGLWCWEHHLFGKKKKKKKRREINSWILHKDKNSMNLDHWVMWSEQHWLYGQTLLCFLFVFHHIFNHM